MSIADTAMRCFDIKDKTVLVLGGTSGICLIHIIRYDSIRLEKKP